MSRNYKFHDPAGLYFISFATVQWVDVFTRRDYKDIVVDSLRYCQEHKGLLLYAWCIMSNHVHLVMEAMEGKKLPAIIRDMKKFTAGAVLKAIKEHPGESRKEWMLDIFRIAGAANPSNTTNQFWAPAPKPVTATERSMTTTPSRSGHLPSSNRSWPTCMTIRSWRDTLSTLKTTFTVQHQPLLGSRDC